MPLLRLWSTQFHPSLHCARMEGRPWAKNEEVVLIRVDARGLMIDRPLGLKGACLKL